MKKIFITVALLSNITAFSTEEFYLHVPEGEKITKVEFVNYENFSKILVEQSPKFHCISADHQKYFIPLKVNKQDTKMITWENKSGPKLRITIAPKQSGESSRNVEFLFKGLKNEQLILSSTETEQYQIKEYIRSMNNWPVIQLKTPISSRRNSDDIATQTVATDILPSKQCDVSVGTSQ